MDTLLGAIGESFRLYWTTSVQPQLAPRLTSLLLALLAVAAARVAGRHARRAVVHTSGLTRASVNTTLLIGRLAEYGLVAFGVLLALSIFGIDLAAVLTLFGAVGLAASLAMQDVLKSFVAGVYLLVERPFQIGDEIKVKDQTGRVVNVGLRTTVLKTSENLQVLVPNSVVFAEVLVNRDGYGGAVPPPPPAPPPAISVEDEGHLDAAPPKPPGAPTV